MKRIFATLIITFGAVMVMAQSITNISPAQRTDGSMIVDITYDLNGPEAEYTIMAEASFDEGITFVHIFNASGDIGPYTTPGTGKVIQWNFGAEFPDQYSSTTQIRITASINPNWICGESFIDDRDGHVYASIEIGSQCWMAENLNIGTMINGSNNQIDNSIIEKYCYANSTANCDEYGGLYQWNEMMEYSSTPGQQGICPIGWHLPTDDEWCTLEQEVDPSISCTSTGWRGVDGGSRLKEAGTLHWLPPNSGANNSSGFTGLPAGYRGNTGTFDKITITGLWWSSSSTGADAWRRVLRYDYTQIYRTNNLKSYGFSVRCLLDD